MRVLAALSGGVDSAVAAAKAVEAGHEVVGVQDVYKRQALTVGLRCNSASVTRERKGSMSWFSAGIDE